MNFRQYGYLLICGLALTYLVVANARGFVPFSGSLPRSSGSSGSGGHAFIFHK